ncbi:MAG: DNA-binding response regulator [Piscirickettsiaceae bacterium]|nr:MAG: DNA-binding response regulator [Piscirickettsiaceae bacterium]PCI72449.1 MAG: DNA-binding response regulator [Piscirickettsiaceae bacterium]
MKILIADDEPLARQRLKRLLIEINADFDILSGASNGLEALNQCISETPDLAILDIRMPTMDGLQAASEIMKAKLNTSVVFVTAYDEYALAAFDKNAIDYLLKPVKKQRLEAMLEKAKQRHLSSGNLAKTHEALSAPRQHLCAHSHLGLQVVNMSDVVCFIADNKYVSAVTATESILLDDSLKMLEKEFGQQFFRVHRNALVNISSIKNISKNVRGQHHVHLDGVEQPISISRRHHPQLNKLLRNK